MTTVVKAQKEKRKISLRDSIDNAVDLSDYLLDAHGFIPLITPITEPAIGFGGAITPIFIEKSKYEMKDNEGNPIYSQPTLNILIAGYTTNKSQFYGIGRMGNALEGNLRYKIMGGVRRH